MRWASIGALSLAATLCATTLLHAQGNAQHTICARNASSPAVTGAR